MADELDLTGEIASAIDGASERGNAPVLGYIDDDGEVALSFRGSTHVHGPQQLAIWVRKRDSGFTKAIAERPKVSLLYYSATGPGPRYLSIRGRARVDPTIDDEAYAKIIQSEREQDPERKGVAVIVDVDSVIGFGVNGQFALKRDDR